MRSAANPRPIIPPLGLGGLRRSPFLDLLPSSLHFPSPIPSSSSSFPLHHLSFPSSSSSSFKFHGDASPSKLCRKSSWIAAMDWDSVDFTSFDDFEDNGTMSGDGFRVISSSEGEESDTELLIVPTTDTDFNGKSSTRVDTSNMDLTVTARLVSMHSRHRNRRILQGILINSGLLISLSLLLLLVDCCSWKVVRLPFPAFYLTRPFFIAAVLASIGGFVCIPLLNYLKVFQILREEGPILHSSKKGTPTMGGLFFIPIGVTVAIAIAGQSSVEVCGAAGATLAYAAIGFLDDILSLLKNHNYGLQPWFKFLLQVAVGICFSLWLNLTDISTPYSMKLLIPLPPPVGLLYLGKFYLVFAAFCFVAMGNGINLTDGLDGLAGGAAAFSFIGMSIAVLPICSELAIFGASMAGACAGFLLHNRYKASVFMGDTGSLALGGALAAMAACTGMFFPLFIVSGVFVLEVLSVITQVSIFKATKHVYGRGRRLFRMAPLHHHLELCGFKEPVIVGNTYVVSFILAVLAGYLGLISA